jgi:hypothetical protein
MDGTCRRCHRPVRSNAAHYETFERMHYVCFHYEFEHGDIDVDDECRSAGCPSASLAGGRLDVIDTARQLAAEAASDAPWRNAATHEFLEAFASWLAESDGFYLAANRVPPGNGWDMVRDALRAATSFE